jgi:hypothetical protein
VIQKGCEAPTPARSFSRDPPALPTHRFFMQPRGEHVRVDGDPGLVFSTDPPSPPVDLVLGKRHQREIPASAMLKPKFELSVIIPLTFSVFELMTPALAVSRWETR